MREQWVEECPRCAVETEDEDRFVLTLGAAIEACRAFSHYETFVRQFRELHAQLSAWIQQHDRDIAEGYLTLRDGGLLFLVVQKSAAFNQELEDSLTDLDIKIAQDDDLNLIRLNVQALPQASEESIQSFLVSWRTNL